MMLNKILYCFRTALQSLRKNILLNLITSTTIAITFIIFVSFLLIVMNLSIFKRNWVDQLQVILYFKDNITAAAMDKTKEYVAGHEEVDSVKFVSRDKALNMLRNSLKGQDGILEGLTENPLPSSLEIKLKKAYLTLEGVEQFVKKIEKNEYLEDIEYGQKWLERFIAFFEILKITGFVVGGFLFLFTLFIISNTIKLMVYNRRDEIEIMKLVGATNRFIKLPFCIEGVIQGLIGASLALLFLFLSVNLVMGRFISSLHFYFGTGNFVFLDSNLTVFVLLLGAVLGLAGSLLSLNSLKELQS
jgi:cell division transport system permease protein